MYSPRTSYSQENTFIRGVDVSFLQQEESHYALFKDGGEAGDALGIFTGHGINYGRLRIWHTPDGGINSLDSTLIMAKRIKDRGMKLLLDFHYSDWWADPAHQTKPVTWDSLSFQALTDSVRAYTYAVITALKNQQTLPDMVQIGNEISCGMLWPEGAVCGGYNTTAQWEKLGILLKSAGEAVDSAASPDAVTLMIHSDRGGDYSAARRFFDHIIEEDVPFDIIGLSYYPWWHGNFNQLKENLDGLSNRYQKNIIVVETAYPWTLDWNDYTHNIVGDSAQVLAGYPATPAGQKTFLRDLVLIIRGSAGGRGLGLFYWEPDWITAVDFGSAWENLAFFDFDGNLMPAIDAMDSYRVAFNLSEGWNIVSLPVKADNDSVISNFPDAVSGAYHFQGSYIEEKTLRAGAGYWLKFMTPQEISIIGRDIDSVEINVNEGWNMVGSISTPVPVSGIVSFPDSIITTGFFTYTGSYKTVDTLYPGHGYWVKVNQGGSLLLSR